MRTIFCLFSTLLIVASSFAGDVDHIQIRLDSSEAEAVLAIVDKHEKGETISDADWQHVFQSRPYQRLKERELSFKNEFTDEGFKQFVLTGDAASRGAELRKTLNAWRSVDLKALANTILPYLPENATINATVYPVIKPKRNSFVWDLSKDPAIFFYIDPAKSGPQFANMAAHELHHVGLHSIYKEYEKRISSLPANAQRAAEWMGSFGEGFAMLAAAGSPDVHPHSTSPQEDRNRWDNDMKNFDSDLRKVDTFFQEVIDGKLSGDQVDQHAMEFFGVQGPWYTVGYKMAATVENRLGREALRQCMQDPRRLLATWNALAGDHAKWSPEVLKATHATAIGKK